MTVNTLLALFILCSKLSLIIILLWVNTLLARVFTDNDLSPLNVGCSSTVFWCWKQQNSQYNYLPIPVFDRSVSETEHTKRCFFNLWWIISIVSIKLNFTEINLYLLCVISDKKCCHWHIFLMKTMNWSWKIVSRPLSWDKLSHMQLQRSRMNIHGQVIKIFFFKSIFKTL